MVTVAVTAVNANIMVNKAGGTAGTKQTLTFTATDWMRKQTVTVTADADLNTINGSATIKHTTVSDRDPAYHKLTVRSVAVDGDRQREDDSAEPVLRHGDGRRIGHHHGDPGEQHGHPGDVGECL